MAVLASVGCVSGLTPDAAGVGPCGEGNGDCCLPHDTPGCDDAGCCNAVCGVAPACCDVAWDTTCADLAPDVCGGLCLGTPANDLCGNAPPLALPPAGDVSVIGTNINATPDGAPFCDVGQAGPGVWYSVIGTGNTITASTCNQADFDTMISVYCGGCAEGELICVAGADDAPGCAGFTTRVSWCSQLDAVYLILVHGFRGGVGSFSLTVFDDGVPCTPTVQCLAPACPWDCDGSGDGNANVSDLLSLLAQYDQEAPKVCDGGESCDYDGNGCVDVSDLLKLLAHFTLDPSGLGCPD